VIERLPAASALVLSCAFPSSNARNQVLFALKMNPSLVAQWGFGATTGDGALIQGQGIGAAPSGKIAYVGIFAGTADFGDGSPRQSANAGAGVNAAVVTRSP